MTQQLIHFFSGVPDWLSVVLLSALPVTELRASLPMALFVYHFSAPMAVILSVIGALIPAPIIFFILPIFMQWAQTHFLKLHTLMERFLNHLEYKHAKQYQQFGALFLFLLIVIPLPGFGVWTGSILAVIFHIDLRYSIPAFILGTFASAGIVLAISVYAGSF